MKHDNKVEYYQRFFAANKNKTSDIWKEIRCIVNLFYAVLSRDNDNPIRVN